MVCLEKNPWHFANCELCWHLIFFAAAQRSVGKISAETAEEGDSSHPTRQYHELRAVNLMHLSEFSKMKET